jgi:hypothetical protein
MCRNYCIVPSSEEGGALGGEKTEYRNIVSGAKKTGARIGFRLFRMESKWEILCQEC